MSVRVSVLVHTFARPRLLRECLLSVAAADPDQVIVIDDGSEGYSVPKVVALALYQRVEYALICAPPMTVAERMVTPRQGKLINQAMLDYVTGDVCCGICDDDLMAPGWLDALRAHWEANPDHELFKGDWLQFSDGETPSLDDPPCPLDPRGMTAGNFAWHMRLVRERGVRWPEGVLHCLDNGFLVSCHEHGATMYDAPHIGSLAGWRRDHPLVCVKHLDEGHYSADFKAALERGYLEPEMAR